MKKTVLAFAAVLALTSSVVAEDNIRMVGSSTVYPFASAIAEEFGATVKGMATPIVESTGTGGGMKIFCGSNDDKSADITNASRRMKASEFETCAKNGVTNITENMIGFDGIAIAQNKKNPALALTREQIFLAVAEQVPSADGKSLIKNPYKKWSEIDAKLPNRAITVYGPPKSSGTRDSFEEMVMIHNTEKSDLYLGAGFKKGYNKVRQDGVYIDSGENDNLIVQKLTKDSNAIGVFGYSFLEENGNKVSGAKIDGFEPTPANIASGAYPISRSLFFYVKNDHRAEKPSINKFVELFMSEKQIGDRGALKRIGLVPADKATRTAAIKNALEKKQLTLADLKSK
jgi:phosphate transport system substrate-binding protein